MTRSRGPCSSTGAVALGLALLCLLALLASLSPLFALGPGHVVGPGPRSGAKMIADTQNHRLILFGGSPGSNQDWSNEVWQLPLDTLAGYCWLPLKLLGPAPCARVGHHMAYDPAGARLLLFGGLASGRILSDLWSLDLTPGAEVWTELFPDGTVPGRMNGSMAFAPERRSLIVFGGFAEDGYLNDLWELDLASLTWRSLMPAGSPPNARAAGGEMLDLSRSRLLLFGGSDGERFYHDLWSLDLTPGNERWLKLDDSGAVPSSRSGFAFAADQKQQKFFIFGGLGRQQPGRRNDLYELDVTRLVWRSVTPAGPLPVGVRDPCGAFDPDGGIFLVFGGESAAETCLAATWYLPTRAEQGLKWHELPPSTDRLVITCPGTGLTVISYCLSQACTLQLRILDQTGALVRKLEVPERPVAYGQVTWDGCDQSGRPVPPGDYHCWLCSGTSGITRKFTLTR